MFGAILIALAVLRCSVCAITTVVTPRQECPSSCDFETVPFFRAFSASGGDHLYTRSLDELIESAATYARQPDAGRVLAANHTGATPLFRLFNPNLVDHFYTVDPDERTEVLANGEGWIDQGVAAFILELPQCGAIPFYRTFREDIADHFYTTDTADLARVITKLDYVFESTVGFIFPAVD